MKFIPAQEADTPYTVSGLNRTISGMLQRDNVLVWVEAEISSLKRHSSGHCYLRLVDEGSQIPAVIWKSYASSLPKDVVEGDRVQIIGQVRVYDRGGYYQLDIKKIMKAGEGDQLIKLEELKKRLNEEGLFNVDRKQPLPQTVNRVAVITAETGAAFHDITNVIARNAPQIDVILVPAAVQGEHAALTLVKALDQINEYGKVDVIIFGRGGGSAEDLSCFNDERVVRAVSSSNLPVISAVGHEVDTTLSDYVADIRAATPSVAAELVVSTHIGDKGRIEELERRFSSLVQMRIGGSFRKYHGGRHSYTFQQVINRVVDGNMAVDFAESRINRGVGQKIKSTRQQVINMSEQLNNLSPLTLMRRGYGVATNIEGEQVNSIEQLGSGEGFTLRLSDGTVNAEVKGVKPL